ncbi:alkaline phosphatase family protein [Salegentibacter sediminis]|uniref:alkaline phosphatase family protein n=1 Tax=Salegentibacter sediminis TaxID=1930251 RepID=UPI0009BFDFBD|nr:alkaline phosphatase family protein [Salegentibacter sediminis]
MKKYVFILILLVSVSLTAQRENKVIWITIDGLRWQELYKGADSLLINEAKFVYSKEELKQKFWKPEEKKRREALFPFFWNEAVDKGVFLGNRQLGNKFSLKNKVLLSYAGYNEILTGNPDDENIKDNSKLNNPNKTLLEILNESQEYQGRIRAFGSWDVFPYILNEERSKLSVNAGYRHSLRENPSPNELLLNKIQDEFPKRWGTVRFDTFTHNYALESLKYDKPLVTYIAYGETDDFAHEGNYQKYLESAHKTDKMIRELWEFVQSDPFYKDQTTFVITTDHGRGEEATEENTWKHHGRSIRNSEQSWFIAFGNNVKELGEAKSRDQYFATQVAATVAKLLNFNYKEMAEVGPSLPVLID